MQQTYASHVILLLAYGKHPANIIRWNHQHCSRRRSDRPLHVYDSCWNFVRAVAQSRTTGEIMCIDFGSSDPSLSKLQSRHLHAVDVVVLGLHVRVSLCPSVRLSVYPSPRRLPVSPSLRLPVSPSARLAGSAAPASSSLCPARVGNRRSTFGQWLTPDAGSAGRRWKRLQWERWREQRRLSSCWWSPAASARPTPSGTGRPRWRGYWTPSSWGSSSWRTNTGSWIWTRSSARV